MKKIIMTLTLLISFSSFADLVINIKTTEGIKLNTIGVYASTSHSIFCTKFGEGFERVPKVFEQNIEVKSSGNSNQINIDENLDDSCRSELKGLSVRVNHPKISSDHQVLEIMASNVNQDQNNQKIIFKKFTSPYGDFYAVGGGNDHILVGPSGLVNAEISLEE